MNQPKDKWVWWPLALAPSVFLTGLVLQFRHPYSSFYVDIYWVCFAASILIAVAGMFWDLSRPIKGERSGE